MIDYYKIGSLSREQVRFLAKIIRNSSIPSKHKVTLARELAPWIELCIATYFNRTNFVYMCSGEHWDKDELPPKTII